MLAWFTFSKQRRDRVGLHCSPHTLKPNGASYGVATSFFHLAGGWVGGGAAREGEGHPLLLAPRVCPPCPPLGPPLGPTLRAQEQLFPILRSSCWWCQARPVLHAQRGSHRWFLGGCQPQSGHTPCSWNGTSILAGKPRKSCLLLLGARRWQVVLKNNKVDGEQPPSDRLQATPPPQEEGSSRLPTKASSCPIAQLVCRGMGGASG